MSTVVLIRQNFLPPSFHCSAAAPPVGHSVLSRSSILTNNHIEQFVVQNASRERKMADRIGDAVKTPHDCIPPLTESVRKGTGQAFRHKSLVRFAPLFPSGLEIVDGFRTLSIRRPCDAVSETNSDGHSFRLPRPQQTAKDFSRSLVMLCSSVRLRAHSPSTRPSRTQRPNRPCRFEPA